MRHVGLGGVDVARIGLGAMGMSAYYTGAREDDEQPIAARSTGPPIPGTRRSERVEENVGADAIELGAGQLDRLNDVEPPMGDRYADMTPLSR